MSSDSASIPPSIRVVVVDDSEEILDAIVLRLRKVPGLEVVGRGLNGREAIQLANRLRPDVMVLDVNMPILNGLEAATRISRAFPRIGLLILTAEESVDTLKGAMKAGVREYLNKMTDLPRIGAAIQDVHARRDTTAHERGLAATWTFYSPKGCCGTTSLALNVATDLASLNYRVLLWDLDLYHGDCSFFLNLEDPDRTGHPLGDLTHPRDIDPERLQPYLNEVSLGPEGRSLTVFVSPRAYVPTSDHSESCIATLLDFLETEYDYVVVDLPSGRILDAPNSIVLDYTERLFLVSNQDACALKATVSFLQVLKSTVFSMNKVSVLLSQLITQPGFDPREWLAGKELGVESIEAVPRDDAVCADAVARGLPTLQIDPESVFSREARRLVERGLNLPPAAPQKQGLWESLIQKFGVT